MTVETSHERDSASPGVSCPDCGRLRMRRLPRSGLMQQKFWPLLGYYPWECPICRRLRLIRYRGKRERRTE